MKKTAMVLAAALAASLPVFAAQATTETWKPIGVSTCQQRQEDGAVKCDSAPGDIVVPEPGQYVVIETDQNGIWRAFASAPRCYQMIGKKWVPC